MAARFLKWGCSSVGRAPALQAGGQEFESLHLHLHVGNEKCGIQEACPRRARTKADRITGFHRAKPVSERPQGGLERHFGLPCSHVP